MVGNRPSSSSLPHFLCVCPPQDHPLRRTQDSDTDWATVSVGSRVANERYNGNGSLRHTYAQYNGFMSAMQFHHNVIDQFRKPLLS